MQEAAAINSMKELHSFSWLLGTEVHAAQQAIQVSWLYLTHLLIHSFSWFKVQTWEIPPPKKTERSENEQYQIQKRPESSVDLFLQKHKTFDLQQMLKCAHHRAYNTLCGLQSSVHDTQICSPHRNAKLSVCPCTLPDAFPHFTVDPARCPLRILGRQLSPVLLFLPTCRTRAHCFCPVD